MDVRALEEGRDTLIATMAERGYSRGYMERFGKMVDFVLDNNGAEQWKGYDDVYDSYCQTTSSEHLKRVGRSILAGIERFHREGKAPGDGRRRPAERPRAYLRLAPEFKSVVDAFIEREAARGAKKDSTIGSEAACASCFLLAVQERGRSRLADVGERDVMSFFVGPDGGMAKSRTYAKSVRAVFKALSDDAECRRILAMLPRPKPRRKPMRRLSDGDVAAIMDVLRSDGVTLRDRAIGLLLVSYGLRRSDVSGLRLSDIGWRSSSLSITQQKTGSPVELPLLPEVGNALYDYVTAERPECDDPYVFQSLARPYGRLSPGGVYGVAVRLLDAAGIERAEGERRGSHVFRHRVATALLEADEARPVISAALGHEDPRSVEAYLSADVAHLRECALSIERFPIPEEVFARWAGSTS